MQKDDSITSAGAEADSGQNDKDIFVSQHGRKPNVSGLPLSNPGIESTLVARFFKWVKKLVAPPKVYFEGRFISERKYIHILSKRYGNMIKRTSPGTIYPTWV